jgi:membrane protease YdiL (CAAX protease family)
MKKLKWITMLAILFCIFVFILTILDFAALHDINREYISKAILKYLNITLSSDPPYWTATKGEWQLVTLSLISRFLFLIFNTSVLFYIYRKVLSNNNRS